MILNCVCVYVSICEWQLAHAALNRHNGVMKNGENKDKNTILDWGMKRMKEYVTETPDE